MPTIFITKRRGSGLERTSVELGSWEELPSHVASSRGEAALFEGYVEGTLLFELMVDAEQAHLTLWESESLAHYLRADAHDEGSRDLGWDVFPAWCVRDRVTAMRAVLGFLETKKPPSCHSWRSEEIDI